MDLVTFQKSHSYALCLMFYRWTKTVVVFDFVVSNKRQTKYANFYWSTMFAPWPAINFDHMNDTHMLALALILFTVCKTIFCWEFDDVLNTSSPQCLPVMRGFLSNKNIYPSHQIKGVRRCPEKTEANLKNLCEEIPPLISNVSATADMEADFIQRMKYEPPSLTNDQTLALRRALYVVHMKSKIVYANIFCAKCNLMEKVSVFNFSSISTLPQVINYYVNGTQTLLIISLEPQPGFVFCELGILIPRFFKGITWDGFFALPKDDFKDLLSDSSELSDAAETVRDVFYICSWVCCVFSIVALVVVICVFSCSSRLRGTLPGKMMIGLCITLLASVVTFASTSLLANLASEDEHPLRWMCVSLAGLLQSLLVAIFTWKVCFACEILSTFGIFALMKSLLRCRHPICGGNRSMNSTVCFVDLIPHFSQF